MFNLRAALNQVRQNMILECEGERHQAENWPDYLTLEWLRARADVESNIYNDGRIEVCARMDVGTTQPHLIFHQIPLNDFTRRI